MKYTKSLTDSVRTPYSLLRYIEKEYGSFYDPCPLNTHYEIDGLKLNWETEMIKQNKNIIYVNPPYSDVKDWILKSNTLKHLTIVYLLKNECMGSKYWRDLEGPFDIQLITPHIMFPGYARKARFANFLLIRGPMTSNSVKFLHRET